MVAKCLVNEMKLPLNFCSSQELRDQGPHSRHFIFFIICELAQLASVSTWRGLSAQGIITLAYWANS